MKKSSRGALAALLAASAFVTAPNLAHANLVTNGSFEVPVVTAGSFLALLHRFEFSRVAGSGALRG